jgi:hypothetical protein
MQGRMYLLQLELTRRVFVDVDGCIDLTDLALGLKGTGLLSKPS